MFIQTHPEQKEDEVFFGNFDSVIFERKLNWASKRRGLHCYHSDMKTPLLSEHDFGLRPVFVKRSEAVQRGMYFGY